MFSFEVIDGPTVRHVVSNTQQEIVDEVENAYLCHDAGRSINPDSYFLRFPEKPESRIIALPAYLGDKYDVAGIKWISSFPKNIARGMPRASAVLLLNDYETGYPFACLEASQISAARTAASAELAARHLTGGRQADRVAVVGAGIIARNILEFFDAQQWDIRSVAVYDHSEKYSDALVAFTEESLRYPASRAACRSDAVDGADLVVLATTASEPYILEPGSFSPGQVVLNVSLRDIGPEVIHAAYNVLDDVEHCLKADMSPHLAEQKYGHRDFVTATLAEVVKGTARTDVDRPTVFSPFGLGILDIAVGVHVYREARDSGSTVTWNDFFAETRRW